LEKAETSTYKPDSGSDVDFDRPTSPAEERPSPEPTAFDEDLSQPDEAELGSSGESGPIQRADWDIPESSGSGVSIDSEPDIPPVPETTEERGYSAADEDRAEPEPDDRYRGGSDSSDDSGRIEQENDGGQQRDDTLPAEEKTSDAEAEADEESKPDDKDESVKWGRNRQR